MEDTTLGESPRDPSSKMDLPCTEQSPQVPNTMLDGRPWPRISIVTPSYNQGQFLEETILSVLNQNYPNLEYIIIDGGSTDNSVEIIRKYADRLAYWVSEPDRGQAHAINKGFERATGDILAWLNSDDTYEPGALMRVGEYFLSNPDVYVVFGECRSIDVDGNTLAEPAYPLKERAPLTLQDWIPLWAVPDGSNTAAIFWRRSALQEVGPLDERLEYGFDGEFLLRLAERYPFYHVPAVLANYRLHPHQKSIVYRDRCMRTAVAVSRRHWGSFYCFRFWRYLLSAWIQIFSIGDAYYAVELSRSNRWRAALRLARAGLCCPVSPFIRPRPFAAALFRIALGWGNFASRVKGAFSKFIPVASVPRTTDDRNHNAGPLPSTYPDHRK